MNIAIEKKLTPTSKNPGDLNAGSRVSQVVAPLVRPISFPHAPLTETPQQGTASPDSSAWRRDGNVSHPIHLVKAALQVYLGSATVTVGELMSATQNQVLVLDRTIGQPVDLLLEGQVVARGELVALEDHFAVRITELPLPLDLAGNSASQVNT